MTQLPNVTVAESARRLELINAGWISLALSAAAELGLADCLAQNALPAKALAEKLNCNADAMRLLLRALASLDIAAENENGTFALLSLGQILRSDVLESLNAQAQWFGRYAWEFWGELAQSVRTGIGGRERKNGVVGYRLIRTD